MEKENKELITKEKIVKKIDEKIEKTTTPKNSTVIITSQPSTTQAPIEVNIKELPKLDGIEVEKAKEELAKIGIEYQEETKKVFSKKIAKGKVVKIEEDNENGNVIIYESRGKGILGFLPRRGIVGLVLLALLVVLLLNPTFGKQILESIQTQILEITDGITPPKITGGSNEWSKERVIYVDKDSKTTSEIDYYEYCIREEKKECKWIKTETKNVKITKSGHYKVIFRGVDKKGKISRASNEEEVYIDNEVPVVNSLNKKIIDNKIYLEIEAIDKLSGVNKYYIKEVSGEYKEVEKKIEVQEGKIVIKVQDKVGNYVEIEYKVELTDEEKKSLVQDINDKDNNIVTTPDGTGSNVTNPDTTTPDETLPEPTPTPTPTDNPTVPKDPMYPPKVNLDKIPLEITMSDEYDIPSYYWFDTYGGEVKCQVDGQDGIINTKDIGLGSHKIECTAYGNNGIIVRVEKDITVTIKTGFDQLQSGWMLLNLYYPANSTNWQWRIQRPGEAITAGWEPYTGPILIKLEDIQYVYTKYKQNNQTVIQAPSGELLLTMEADSYIVDADKTTNVRIYYENGVRVKEYRVDYGPWLAYTGSIQVNAGAYVEAREEKDINVYDDAGDYQYTVTKKKEAQLKIESQEPYIAGPIVAQDTYSMVDSTDITLTTREAASSIEISIDGADWKPYTGAETITKNVLIMARYTRASDGRVSSITYYQVRNVKTSPKPTISYTMTPSDFLETSQAPQAQFDINTLDADTVEYSLDGVNYQAYQTPLTLTGPSIIYVKATNRYGTTNEKYYVPATYVPAPQLTQVVATNRKSSTITITPTQIASDIYYYHEGLNGWQQYTGPFTVTENVAVTAKYKRKSDGKWSEDGSIYVRGIQDKLPWISIDANPSNYENMLDLTSIQVTINAGNYDTGTLEYSLDGITYQPYTTSFTITENTTVYAKATNYRGTRKENKYIMLKLAGPVITQDTTAQTLQTIVTLTSPSTASSTYYCIDGVCKLYTGPFTLTENKLISAYYVRSSDNKVSEKSYYSVRNIRNLYRPNIEISITPGNYYYTPNLTVTANIICHSNCATPLEYSLDGTNYQTYTSPVTVAAGMRIYARSTSSENVTKVESLYVPLNKLGGPITIVNPPYQQANGVIVTLIPSYTASKIEISLDGGVSYQAYTSPVSVTKNGIIKARYTRASDGMQSEITTFEIDNIKANFTFSATPSNYNIVPPTDVEVEIKCSECRDLRYSTDKTIWVTDQTQAQINSETIGDKTTKVKLYSSGTIYARAVDRRGNVVYDSKVITFAIPPSALGSNSGSGPSTPTVAITADPSMNPDNGILPETEITINYTGTFTNKYYELASDNKVVNYTGSFYLDKNDTIYAYGKLADGTIVTDVLQIDFLTGGISAPIISYTPTITSSSKTVTIKYSRKAVTMEYKIDDGDWKTYTGPFTITENHTIFARNSNLEGDSNDSSMIIDMIASLPNYTLLKTNEYYLLKLNYSSASDPNTREYKWTKDGVWKQYDDTKGVLLVSNELKNNVSASGLQITDPNGNQVVYQDHFYFVDLSTLNLTEDLFMRWDTAKPATPQIQINPEDISKQVTVSITYDPSSVKSIYKLVDIDGNDSGWMAYTGPFIVGKNETMIYAKSENVAEVVSDLGKLKIKNVDDEKPEIDAVYDSTTPRRQLTIQLVGTDNLEIDKVGYVVGSQNASYFENGGGTYLANKGVITVTENGIYTIAAVDKVGNVTVKQIQVTNIDRTAPNVIITPITTAFGTKATIRITFGDSNVKEYSIGNNTNYHSYPATGDLELTSYDVYDLANPDKTLTIYAKGTDQAGNVTEVSETIYTLDLDMLAKPVITSGLTYGIITTTGIKLDGVLKVTYDSIHSNLLNEISLDAGATWKVYTGAKNVTEGIVKARSTKISTGLKSEEQLEVKYSENALKKEAYDQDPSTNDTILAYGKGILEVENDGKIKNIKIRSNTNGTAKVSLYGTGGEFN